ncbi:unnamed protein product [Arctia plantaginis]|uniref:Tetraspanin n=1 Tax=Arctia plantaginis TaxID=874455 RepID=A0A8S1ABV1_ARCPL|nr:unnamed protein product [Arctia plantaginis]
MTSYINHPFVVWGSCYLWLTALFAIIWSLLLFVCIGDMLILTGTDLINAIVLLSGILTLPANIHILCAISNGKKIDYKSRVLCCPLWLCFMWIILINCIGVVLCAHKIAICRKTTHDRLNNTIKHYRSIPRYKHFVDNLQWSLKCCGLYSYKDWFDYDWYDKVRDYDWDPPKNPLSNSVRFVKPLTDSVPLSCCKSGSCIANYLLELGTGSINTRGCGDIMTNIMMTLMTIHIIMFVSVITVEAILLKVLIGSSEQTRTTSPMRPPCCKEQVHLRNIMSIKNNFRASSTSLRLMPDESDGYDKIVRQSVTSRDCLRHPRASRADLEISRQ